MIKKSLLHNKAPLEHVERGYPHRDHSTRKRNYHKVPRGKKLRYREKLERLREKDEEKLRRKGLL